MEENFQTRFEYIGQNRLFTAILLPGEGKYPVIVTRTPYVDGLENKTEEEALRQHLAENRTRLAHGYVMVRQHCRGTGLSGGDCVPYIHEREDGLELQEWIRHQDFYNGEIYLLGASYLSSVQYATAPFAADIKGAVFNVQDTERYRVCYRNGLFKNGLHGQWFVGMYHKKTMKHKNYTADSFLTLPLSDFTKNVFGEPVECFDDTLKSPSPSDPFWQTLAGGTDSRDAVTNTNIPVLLTTGFYDIYTGAIVDMWRKMTPATRARSVLMISPYNHGCTIQENSLTFPNGLWSEAYPDYDTRWFDYIRGKEKNPPVPVGKVTYYTLFENAWHTDDFAQAEQKMRLTLGEGKTTYVYNPYAPASFQGGLSRTFGGAVFQDKPNSRYDIVSLFSEPFEKDTVVKGKMAGNLRVSTDCEDTCFLLRVSIRTEQGDFPLRDDIDTVCRLHPDYKPGETVDIPLDFDDHSFVVKKGQQLRFDLSSSDAAHYVRHTNLRGLYSEQTTAKVAHNTVDLGASWIELPIKE